MNGEAIDRMLLCGSATALTAAPEAVLGAVVEGWAAQRSSTPDRGLRCAISERRSNS